MIYLVVPNLRTKNGARTKKTQENRKTHGWNLQKGPHGKGKTLTQKYLFFLDFHALIFRAEGCVFKSIPKNPKLKKSVRDSLMSWSFLTRKFKIRQKIAPWNLSGSLVVLIISPKPWRTWNLRNRQLRKVIPGKKIPKLGSSSWGRTTNSGGFVWQFLEKSKDFFCETYQHFHPKTPVVWSQKFQEDFSKNRFSKHRAFWASENLANAFNDFFGDDVRNTRCWGKTPETLKMNVKVNLFCDLGTFLVFWKKSKMQFSK